MTNKAETMVNGAFHPLKGNSRIVRESTFVFRKNQLLIVLIFVRIYSVPMLVG